MLKEDYKYKCFLFLEGYSTLQIRQARIRKQEPETFLCDILMLLLSYASDKIKGVMMKGFS